VLGDFNQNVAFDKNKGFGRRFKDVLDVFERLQMTSAWHGHHGELHGAESMPTSHWMWQLDRPYHVDYAFVPRHHVAISDVRIGRYEDYVVTRISDHLPLKKAHTGSAEKGGFSACGRCNRLAAGAISTNSSSPVKSTFSPTLIFGVFQHYPPKADVNSAE
jgi:hypothetical protein